MKLSELAKHLDATLIGDGTLEIRAVTPISIAQEGDATFLLEKKHKNEAATSQASALITYEELKGVSNQLLIKNPKKALAQTLKLFHPQNTQYSRSETPISRSAEIDKTVYLGHYVSIGNRTTLDANTYVANSVVIGDDCTIGSNCTIHPGVIIQNRTNIGNNVIVGPGTVIGSSGFGYYPDDQGHWIHIPQVGSVVIEDGVEIGANTTIDRACMGVTTIKNGTKIDNLVHIAHNNSIGENCIIAAQTGLTGSSTLESHVMIGGQVGIDNATIGKKSIIAARAGVTKNIPEGQMVSGFPAWEHQKELKKEAFIRRRSEKGSPL